MIFYQKKFLQNALVLFCYMKRIFLMVFNFDEKTERVCIFFSNDQLHNVVHILFNYFSQQLKESFDEIIVLQRNSPQRVDKKWNLEQTGWLFLNLSYWDSVIHELV